MVIEPPFEPYSFKFLPKQPVIVDDGRKSTFLSSLADRLTSVFKPHPDQNRDSSDDRNDEAVPVQFTDVGEMRELSVTIPIDSKIHYEYADHLLTTLSSFSFPISFEILGTHERISVQFACRESDIQNLSQHIRSYFPDATVAEGISLSNILNEHGLNTVIVDCGLNEEFMRPIRTYKSFDPDPLTAIFGTLDNLQAGDVGLVQVLFQSANAPWASNILNAVRNDDGTSFFADAPEMVSLAEKKVERPLFSVVLRLIGQSKTKERAWEIIKTLNGNLNTFSDPLSNSFIPLSNDNLDDNIHRSDVLNRQSHRSGMLLSSEELIGLVHLPSPTVHAVKLKRDSVKSRSVPSIATGHEFIIGENVHRNVRTKVSLNTVQQLRHTHVIGKTGMGKTVLLEHLILGHVNSKTGIGVAVLDPHGDLIDRIVERIPDHRMDDVILFDPNDTEYPIGFNLLEARTEIEKTVLSSDLVELFRRFSTSWGDQMTAVLANAITAFVESDTGGTLVDLKRFLLEPEFRKQILSQNVDSSTVYFWEKEFPLLKGSSQVSIITRLDAFLRSKLVRNIITQREGLNFGDIIENKKIFLAKLSQGIIGEENAYLLGSLICSKLHQVVMGRQTLSIAERSPFFCYIDEFQNFATPSMASILSGSRKYSFGLTISHQDLQQIVDNALLNSVITNPAIRICFALGDNDAQKLSSGFAHFDENDLMNLGIGEAIVRVERNDDDFNLKTFNPTVVDRGIAQAKRERIVTYTRNRYSKRIPMERTEGTIKTPEKVFIPKPKTFVPQTNTELSSEPSSERISIKEKIESALPAQPSIQKNLISEDYLVTRKNLSQHRYLQTLIKKMAEQRGFRAESEKPTPDGGRVDVGLEFNAKRIAVEICNTTGEAQELHNIEKCIKAGYEIVVSCSTEKKTLEAIKKLVSQKLSERDFNRVRFFTPEDLFSFLDQMSLQGLPLEQRFKGYRVKVQYHSVSESEKQQRKDTVSHVIVQTLKRVKERS